MFKRFIAWIDALMGWESTSMIGLYVDKRKPTPFVERLFGRAVYEFFNQPIAKKQIKVRRLSFRTSVDGYEGWYEFALVYFETTRRFERYRFKKQYVYTVRFRGPLDGVSFSVAKNVVSGKKMWRNFTTDDGMSYYETDQHETDYERLARAIRRAQSHKETAFADTVIASLAM